jgi:hypothetical protein
MEDQNNNLKKIAEKLPPTQSQRLRATLYRLWEVEKYPDETFDEYYKEHMEKIINWVKSKLPK